MSAPASSSSSSSSQPPLVHALFIINKAGGMIYHKNFIPPEQRKPLADGNSSLRLASVFHALHVMAKDLAPAASQPSSSAGSSALSIERGASGIRSIEAGSFRVESLQTLTGTTFFVVASNRAAMSGQPTQLADLLRDLYVAYSDYVLKNPFFIDEQPISKTCELFNVRVRELIAAFGAPKRA